MTGDGTGRGGYKFGDNWELDFPNEVVLRRRHILCSFDLKFQSGSAVR